MPVLTTRMTGRGACPCGLGFMVINTLLRTVFRVLVDASLSELAGASAPAFSIPIARADPPSRLACIGDGLRPPLGSSPPFTRRAAGASAVAAFPCSAAAISMASVSSAGKQAPT